MEISLLKELNNVSTSEDLFGIESPPDHQCERITSLVKSMQYIEKESNLPRYFEEEDVVFRLEKINSETYRLDEELEEVRSAIEGVRAWGEEWKNVVKRLIEQNLIDLDGLGLETNRS